MGEVDPLGTRKDGLYAVLDQKVAEGYVIETRGDTHAINNTGREKLVTLNSYVPPAYTPEGDELPAAKPR